MAKQTTPAITFTPQAFELIRSHMDDEGRLNTPVRVSLECVRAMWVADARQRVAMDDITLPRGSDIGTITDMLAFAAEVRSEDSRISGWRMPPLSTAYLCDDGRVRTIGEMLEGISVDLMPHDDVDLDMLMSCFGCDWTNPLSPTSHPKGLLIG